MAQINTEQVLRIGQNALYFEDYMLSIQYFNQVIDSKPYLARPYFLRAIAKLNLDDYRGAEADATRSIELNPYLTDAYEVRGVARQNSGKPHAAIDDYTEALKLLPRNRQLMFNRALALAQIGRHADADSAFTLILRYYPRFDNALLGRARARLALADTTAALADIDNALQLNRNALNAYIMRADIAINSHGDYAAARNDIDRAIRLEPKMAGLYINRAYLRYKTDDYPGAVADYDYALTLEPYNMTALFNRGLLLMEVSAYDMALDNFDRVLDLDPDNMRALYNRAIINMHKGNNDQAISDITRVAEANPEIPDTYFMRAGLYKKTGNLARAEADYKHARALALALPPEGRPLENEQDNSELKNDYDDSADAPASTLTQRKFAQLLTVDDNVDLREEYNNSAIRGRVQDRNLNIEIEPMLQLSFYASPNELSAGTHYMRQIDDLNATRALRMALLLTNQPPAIDTDQAAKHFQSIEYYNSYLATHTPRPVDYLGRALDFLTVRDYASAEKDALRALELTPSLELAYMIHAQAIYGIYLLESSGATGGDAGSHHANALESSALARKHLDDIASDYRKAIELAPLTPALWFNLGNILFTLEDLDGATEAYTKAIELKDNFGQAYYNRGYISLRQGNRAGGIADLSKAGELGIIPAYNLIKRISH